MLLQRASNSQGYHHLVNVHPERKETSEKAQLQKKYLHLWRNRYLTMRSDLIMGVNIHSEDAAIPLVKTQVACKFLRMPTKNRMKSPTDVFTVSTDDTKRSQIMDVLEVFPRRTYPFCLTQLCLVHYLVPSEEKNNA